MIEMATRYAPSLGLVTSVDILDDWPLATSRVVATCAAPSGLSGSGSGSDPETASVIAVMEAIERVAQFGERQVEVATVDSRRALGDIALDPRALGLYAEEQYRGWHLPVRRYRPDEPVTWVRARRLRDGVEVLVPLETVHPRAVTSGGPLVLETSSGTAAAATTEDAVSAALSEVVERDACLVWWHRRPSTAAPDLLRIPDLAADLDRLASYGYVIVARLLPAAAGMAVVLLVALRRTATAIGVGCAADVASAARHALRELGVRLRWIRSYPSRQALHAPITSLAVGVEHAGLYDRGPLHGVLREALDETSPAELSAPGTVAAPAGATVAVLGAGLDPLVIALPVPPAIDGIHVARVLVPGLVPFWVGAGHERLGCDRLMGRQAPGRLVTLLPHPFG